MRRPSGDHDGLASTAELSVSRETSDPSAFIAYISEFPSLSDTNAMRPASGAGVFVGMGVFAGAAATASGCHQDGYESEAGLLVSRMTSDPSAFIAYISQFPSLLDVNAMRRPSGDHDGCASEAELLVSRMTSDPSAFIAYISWFPSL